MRVGSFSGPKGLKSRYLVIFAPLQCSSWGRGAGPATNPLCSSPPRPPPPRPPPPCHFPKRRLQRSDLLLAAGQLLQSRALARAALARAALALPRPRRGVWLEARCGERAVAVMHVSHCDAAPCHTGLRGPATSQPHPRLAPAREGQPHWAPEADTPAGCLSSAALVWRRRKNGKPGRNAH